MSLICFQAVGLVSDGDPKAAEEYAQRVLDQFDRDGDGQIDLDEFMLFQIHLKQAHLRKDSFTSKKFVFRAMALLVPFLVTPCTSMKYVGLCASKTKPAQPLLSPSDEADHVDAESTSEQHSSQSQRIREAFGHKREISVEALTSAMESINLPLSPDEVLQVFVFFGYFASYLGGRLD